MEVRVVVLKVMLRSLTKEGKKGSILLLYCAENLSLNLIAQLVQWYVTQFTARAIKDPTGRPPKMISRNCIFSVKKIKVFGAGEY